MAGSSFGNLFRITTWGESHGKAIGVVIDGCPAGLALTEADIQPFLNRRKPGQSRQPRPGKRRQRQRERAELADELSSGLHGMLLSTRECARETDKMIARQSAVRSLYPIRLNHASQS